MYYMYMTFENTELNSTDKFGKMLLTLRIVSSKHRFLRQCNVKSFIPKRFVTSDDISVKKKFINNCLMYFPFC